MVHKLQFMLDLVEQVIISGIFYGINYYLWQIFWNKLLIMVDFME